MHSSVEQKRRDVVTTFDYKYTAYRRTCCTEVH